MLIKPDGVQLSLDPGAPRRQRSISGCKCLLITFVIIIFTGVGLSVLGFATHLLAQLLEPHSALYQNATLDGVSSRATVVQPLITRDQTFDIVATVWLRSSETKGHGEPVEGQGVEVSETMQAPEVLETPLYSDIAFRGLTLTQKSVFSTINFTLPTAIL